MPPERPLAGNPSATTSRPSATQCRSGRHRLRPRASSRQRRERLATRRAIGTPSTSTAALSTPMRRLAPPHSTAPIGGCHQPLVGKAAGIELVHEHGDALGLVTLADCRRHLLQTAQAAQEPAIRLVGPAHVARAAPTVGAQGIEAAVIADAIRRIALDRVATQAAQRSPCVERTRVGRNHRGDQRTAIAGWRGERLLQGDGRPLRPRPAARYAVDRRGASRSSAHSRDHPTAYGSSMTAMTFEIGKEHRDRRGRRARGAHGGAGHGHEERDRQVDHHRARRRLAFGVWTQRSACRTAPSKVKDRAALGDTSDVTCTFFGTDITINVPSLP